MKVEPHLGEPLTFLLTTLRGHPEKVNTRKRIQTSASPPGSLISDFQPPALPDMTSVV